MVLLHNDSVCLSIYPSIYVEGAAERQGGRGELHAGPDGAGGVRSGGAALQEPGGPAVRVRPVPPRRQQLGGKLCHNQRGVRPLYVEMLPSKCLGPITDHQNHDLLIADHRIAGE